MLEKLLLSTLVLGMLLAFALTKAVESDRPRAVAADPGSVTIDLRR